MPVRAIWAQARTGVIGADGGMPWDVPEDMAFFKRATSGTPVLMGRRTWQSFPDRFRPLPDRPNIVVTRDASFDAPGATVVHSLDAALDEAARLDDEAWVIGGAEIYRQAMPRLDELWVTRIDLDLDGDAYAPEIDDAWHVVRSDPAAPDEWHTSRTGTRYRFEVLRRS
ncbi:dihydrofolate reductase [Microbacterium marinilacus]|uniref:Dihydrofolate reductase n=1 Tax=Microbacterium marinilacus TaxID=415209 RepID=A0ABP7BR25_9MICO|nr:dihydrofolate reductase [Microbacterium marinilacus]MBY0689851.1 dihydrofolate reductase [Microbacterium marinilacus]